MADTGWKNTGAILTVSGLQAGINGRLVYNNPTRSNNTVTFTGVYAQGQFHGTAGSFTWYPGWDINGEVPSGSQRVHGHWTGSRNRGNIDTTGTAGGFTMGVSASATTVNVRVGGKFRDDGWAFASWTISIPALGAPEGTTTIDSATHNSISLRNNVTYWGASATAGSVRSYIADNSGFSGQTYIGASDNNLVTQTGLTANKRYWLRGWSSNGGGKSAYMNTVQAVTLANATETSKEVLATTASFVTSVAQGEYATTAFAQYREVGEATWVDGAPQTGATPTVEITGLQPSTDYEYRLAVMTTAGTWYGAVKSLTSMPAGKIVMPDGTVKSAIPRLVMPDGTVTMVNVNIINNGT